MLCGHSRGSSCPAEEAGKIVVREKVPRHRRNKGMNGLFIVSLAINWMMPKGTDAADVAKQINECRLVNE